MSDDIRAEDDRLPNSCAIGTVECELVLAGLGGATYRSACSQCSWVSDGWPCVESAARRLRAHAQATHDAPPDAEA